MCPNSQWRHPRHQTTKKYNNVQKKNKKIKTRAETQCSECATKIAKSWIMSPIQTCISVVRRRQQIGVQCGNGERYSIQLFEECVFEEHTGCAESTSKGQGHEVHTGHVSVRKSEKSWVKVVVGDGDGSDGFGGSWAACTIPQRRDLHCPQQVMIRRGAWFVWMWKQNVGGWMLRCSRGEGGERSWWGTSLAQAAGSDKVRSGGKRRGGDRGFTRLQHAVLGSKSPPNIKSPHLLLLQLLGWVRVHLTGFPLSMLDANTQSYLPNLADGTLEILYNVLLCCHFNIIDNHSEHILLVLGQRREWAVFEIHGVDAPGENSNSKMTRLRKIWSVAGLVLLL
ncbi:hypothetical protein B0H13DRAFT_1891106 [Mycena leptocephala]|nr:hypothetical protein B0H13DRAFT_1891106 [Mycena leptocephala]